VRRLAYEAADSGLLSPHLAAGIRRVKGSKKLGIRLGNWLAANESSCALELRLSYLNSARCRSISRHRGRYEPGRPNKTGQSPSCPCRNIRQLVTLRRCEPSQRLVMVRVFLLKDIDKALSSYHLNTFAIRVVIQVIGILNTRERGDHVARFHVEHTHAWWFVCADK
jgi:hypothetical protein